MPCLWFDRVTGWPGHLLWMCLSIQRFSGGSGLIRNMQNCLRQLENEQYECAAPRMTLPPRDNAAAAALKLRRPACILTTAHALTSAQQMQGRGAASEAGDLDDLALRTVTPHWTRKILRALGNLHGDGAVGLHTEGSWSTGTLQRTTALHERSCASIFAVLTRCKCQIWGTGCWRSHHLRLEGACAMRQQDNASCGGSCMRGHSLVAPLATPCNPDHLNVTSVPALSLIEG